MLLQLLLLLLLQRKSWVRRLSRMAMRTVTYLCQMGNLCEPTCRPSRASPTPKPLGFTRCERLLSSLEYGTQRCIRGHCIPIALSQIVQQLVEFGVCRVMCPHCDSVWQSSNATVLGNCRCRRLEVWCMIWYGHCCPYFLISFCASKSSLAAASDTSHVIHAFECVPCINVG